MATQIRTAQHALNTLRKARELDGKATQAEIKAIHAVHNRGTYSGHYARAERWANEAAAKFLAVEEYLASLT